MTIVCQRHGPTADQPGSDRKVISAKQTIATDWSWPRASPRQPMASNRSLYTQGIVMQSNGPAAPAARNDDARRAVHRADQTANGDVEEARNCCSLAVMAGAILTGPEMQACRTAKRFGPAPLAWSSPVTKRAM